MLEIVQFVYALPQMFDQIGLLGTEGTCDRQLLKQTSKCCTIRVLGGEDLNLLCTGEL